MTEYWLLFFHTFLVRATNNVHLLILNLPDLSYEIESMSMEYRFGGNQSTKELAFFHSSHFSTSSLLLPPLNIKQVISQWLLRVFKHTSALIVLPSKGKTYLSSKYSIFCKIFHILQDKICTNASHGPKYLPSPLMGAFQDYFLRHLFLRKWWSLPSSGLYRHVGWWHQYFLLTYSPPKLKITFATKFQLWKPDGGLKCDRARCLIPFQMFNDLPLVDKRLENQSKVQKSEKCGNIRIESIE